MQFRKQAVDLRNWLVQFINQKSGGGRNNESLRQVVLNGSKSRFDRIETGNQRRNDLDELVARGGQLNAVPSRAQKCARQFFFERPHLLPNRRAGETKSCRSGGKRLPARQGNQTAKLLESKFLEVVAGKIGHRR